MAWSTILNQNEYNDSSFAGNAYSNEDTGIPALVQDIAEHVSNIFFANSNSSILIGTGTKTFILLDTKRPYSQNTPIIIRRSSSPTTVMSGTVSSYDSVTNTLVVDVTYFSGSGTFTDWSMEVYWFNYNSTITNFPYKGALASNPPIAAAGDMYFNTGDSQVKVYTGSIWKTAVDTYTRSEVDAKLVIATQAEAEAGSENTKFMTSLRTTQNVTARIATQAEAEAGSNTVKVMTPQRTTQNVTARIATQAEAEAGVDNTKLMTPLRTAQEIVAKSLLTNATITSTSTLTVNSPVLNEVNMTTIGLSVLLPNATTIPLGRTYTFKNGGMEFGVRDTSGTLVARSAPGNTITVSLVNNSTANGVWAPEGVGTLLPVTRVDRQLLSSMVDIDLGGIALSPEIALFFCKNIAGLPHVVAQGVGTTGVVDGSPTMLSASAISYRNAIRISNTKAMVILNSATNNLVNVTVDPSTMATVVSSSASSSVLALSGNITGAPIAVSLNTDLHVGIGNNGGLISIQAVNTAGTSPVAGTAYTGSAVIALVAVYRESATTGVGFYTANSLGDYSLLAIPFSVDPGTLAITVGTTVVFKTLVNDGVPVICQHAAGLYTAAFLDAGNSDITAVGITVASGVVTFGTRLVVEAGTFTESPKISACNADQKNPNMYAIDSTRALFTWGFASAFSRHIVLTNTAGTLTAGQQLTKVFAWNNSNCIGGNFPQQPTGFLAIGARSNLNAATTITEVGISGTTLSVLGSAEGTPYPYQGYRFAVSGKYFGVIGGYLTAVDTILPKGTEFLFYRRDVGTPVRYLGSIVNNNFIAPSSSTSFGTSFVGGLSITNTTITNGGQIFVRLFVLEFPK